MAKPTRALLIAALALVACGKSKSNDNAPTAISPPTAPPASRTPPTRTPPTGTIRLFSDDEIARGRAELTAALVDNAKRTCPRPVLTGSPTPGPARPDMLAIYEPSGPLLACLDRLAKLAGTGNLHQLADARAPEMLAINATCGAQLEASVRAAIQHEDSCSPYQIGQRAMSENFIHAIQLTHLLGLRADLAAEHGDVAGALGLMFATIRFAQDLGRGHFTLLGQMVGTASSDIAIEHVHAILAKAKPTGAALAPLIAQIDALLLSDPPFADALAGEHEQFALYLGEAAFQPDGWVPPGGWPTGTSKPAVDPASTLDPRDSAALMLATAGEVGRATAAACPSDSTFAACHAGLAKLADAPVDTDTDAARLFAKLVKAGTVDPAAIKTAMIHALSTIAAPSYAGYVARRARMVALLAALRVELEVARTVDRTTHCPTQVELGAQPFATLLSPDRLGGALIATRQPTTLTIDLPAFVPPPTQPWLVTCP